MPFFAHTRLARAWCGLALFLMLLSGCAQPASGRSNPGPMRTPTRSAPSPTAVMTATRAAPTPTPAPTIPAVQMLWVSDALPRAFRQELALPDTLQITMDENAADFRLQPAPPDKDSIAASTHWVYALVAPFPTLTDDVTDRALQVAWQGKPTTDWKDRILLVSEETRAVLETRWQAAGPNVQTVKPAQLLETAWQGKNTWAILPFEEIEARWKVIRVNGVSPLDTTLDETSIDRYPLAIPITLLGSADKLPPGADRLPTNRDTGKLTTVAMTGVTALARHTAARMESEGLTYPARDIGDWLREADLTHISNEVSFKKDCPDPRPDMRFCSQPEYIKLLEAVGTDIVELTGNHNLDWGPEPYLETLEMYQERGWLIYGGGANLEAAQKPLLVEHNGNRLAFLGCSPSGPEAVWATEETPGSAPCDLDEMAQTIEKFRAQGVLPIVTFQHVETDWYVPTLAQRMPDFRRMAEAGAVVVQGSQAHFPQTMTFVEDRFIHYGLGNLFFDQMEPKTIRQAFIDRHVFYDGRYLGVQLMTTMLEDSARPRPMTVTERTTFLEKVFSLSLWGEISP